MNHQTKEVAGITYTTPTVIVLQQSPLLVAEYAGRTAYDSFGSSEHDSIANEETYNLDAEHSDLLDSLAWVHHHHSVLEHLSLSYLIKGTSRGVLQEVVRHRIASYTVRSTRYTMSSVINAFVASLENSIQPIQFFRPLVKKMDLFVITDDDYLNIEIESIFKKLLLQRKTIGIYEFERIAIPKSSLPLLRTIQDPSDLFKALEAGRKKRNVGDNFKHIVTDNWKVDLVVTFNLRSLRNFFTLRDSNAAYYQIKWLAQEMKKATPSKYLDLIVKPKKAV